MPTSDPPLDAETRAVIKLLRDVAARCQKIMLQPPGGTEKARTFNASRAAQQLQGINRELDAVQGKLAKVAAKKIAAAYQTGLIEAEKQATAAGVIADDLPLKGGFSVVDRRRAQVLAQQAVNDLTMAVISMRENTGKIVRKCQALGLDNAKVNLLLAGGTIEGKPKAVLRELRKAMQRVAIDGKIVTVNTRTGNVMHFDPRYYADLVFQTKSAEAATTALMERLQSKGMFYVKVIGRSSRNFCSAFLDRVFYIGPGADPGGKYPSNRQLPRGGPPFHPRCSKRFVAFVAALASPKQIEASVLKPHEREMLGKPSNEVQKLFAKRTPPKPVAPPPAKPAAGNDNDDQPVLVGRADDQGNVAVRFEIADQTVAESASRAWKRAKDAGYKVPSHFVDAPDLAPFQGESGKVTMAAYGAKEDKVFINPGAPFWGDLAGNMKRTFDQKVASSADIDHIFMHEIGHYVHRHAAGIERYTAVRKERFTAAERILVGEHVSLYAATKPVELVAEVFAGRLAGKTFPDSIMALFKRFGGI